MPLDRLWQPLFALRRAVVVYLRGRAVVLPGSLCRPDEMGTVERGTTEASTWGNSGSGRSRMKFTLEAHLTKVCCSCQQKFYAVRSTQLYCSKSCQRIAAIRKGLDNPGELTDKPIVTYATSAAIPPQNLAYRWLYQNPDVHMAAVPSDRRS